MSRSLFENFRSSYFSITVVALFSIFAGNLQAQTNPTPQAIPYSQSFSSFTGSATTYPAGWQGWTIGENLGTTPSTTAPDGDQVLVPGVSDGTTTPAFVGDMVGKIAALSTGSNIRPICLALNTTGLSNLVVTFTVATQEQVGPGGRVDQMNLQYRVGQSGPFTTISGVGTTYQNDNLALQQTAGVTTGTSPATLAILLPPACNNSPTVQVRWIESDVLNNTGPTGTRPSFSITNVSVAPGVVTSYYSKSTGNLDNLATWGTNTDGSGTAPTNFIGNLHEFHIVNGNPGTLSGNWTISGTASKLVVDGTNFTVPSTHSVTGTIDVNAGRTLTLANTTLPTFGAIDPASTITFSGINVTVIPSVTYGNIGFTNANVALPASNSTIVFAGNCTLTSSTINGNPSNAYSLVTTGSNNQLISGNGSAFAVRNIDIGNTNPKAAGTVTLAPNTNITVANSLLMNIIGPAAQFVDGGNTLSVFNNIDLTGNAAGYNFTGTIVANGTSGTQNFRGGGSSSLPCVAALNNVTFTVSSGGEIKPSAGGSSLTIKGNLEMDAAMTGTFKMNANTLYLGGNFIDNLTTENINTASGSLIQFNGTGTQNYTSSVTAGSTINNVQMNNTGGGLTLNSPLNVTGVLTLTSGKINTGANLLKLSSTATVSGGSSASYVNGGLSKAMPSAGAGTIQFEVGDATYAPVAFTLGGSLTTGSLVVRSTAGAHPQIGGSYVNTSNMVNRYWTITNAGITTGAINVGFYYASGDLTSGSSNAGYILRQYAASEWTSAPNVTNATGGPSPFPGYSTITVNLPGSSFSGDYVAGLPACSVPASGAAIASPVQLCVSGTSSLSLTGGSSGNSIGYQWSKSSDGTTFNPIVGATSATFTTPTITATTYYNATLTCLLTTSVSTSTTATVTVNATPPAITGSASQVCEGLNIGLSDATTGGTWTSSNTAFATVDPASGVVTGVLAGSPVISYTAPSTGCISATTITVNPSPSSIFGATSICTGLNATLSNSVTGGAWTSSNSSVATVNSATRTVYATTIGSTTITYKLPAGCMTTSTINVVSSPAVISGPTVLCTERPVTLSDAAGSGTWSSSNSAIVIGSISGIVTAHAIGTANIYYSLGSGCQSVTTVTVNQSPADITGAGPVCLGGPILNLHDATGSGTWSSNDVAVATVSGGGAVTNISPGTAIITYGISNGCTSTASVVVNPTSPVSGAATICQGDSTLVSDIVPGGIWTSNNTGVATVGSVTGTVTGISAGTAILTYTLPSTCYEVALATVNALPTQDTVSGGGNYCSGGAGVHINLDSSQVGINYQLYNGSVAIGSPFAGTGNPLDFGLQTALGTYTVMATNAATGCISNMISSAPVDTLPLPLVFTVTGGGGYCLTDLLGVHIGLDGSQINVNYNLVPFGGTTAGTGSALDLGAVFFPGNYTVIATSTVNSCTVTMNGPVGVHVNLPPAFHLVTVTRGGNYCVGDTGVHVGLNGSNIGVKYQLYNNGAAVGTGMFGTGSALDYGLFTTVGTYTITATDTATGCSIGMFGSAVVVANPLVTPTVNISTNVGAGNQVCLGSPVTFTAQTTYGGTIPTYVWKVDGFSVGTSDSTYNYTPNNGDVITVEMNSDALCAVPDSATNSMTIDVITPTTPSVFIDALTSISPGESDTLRAVVTNGGPSPAYQWYKNGMLIPGATNSTYISNAFASHDSVTCRVISSGGCGGVVTFNSVIITVFATGVTTVTVASDIKLFPNPSMGTFTVKGSLGTTDDQYVALTVTDMIGKVIYANNVIAKNGNLNEQISLDNSIANGMYLLEVHSGTEVKTFHFVVGK